MQNSEVLFFCNGPESPIDFCLPIPTSHNKLANDTSWLLIIICNTYYASSKIFFSRVIRRKCIPEIQSVLSFSPLLRANTAFLRASACDHESLARARGYFNARSPLNPSCQTGRAIGCISLYTELFFVPMSQTYSLLDHNHEERQSTASKRIFIHFCLATSVCYDWMISIRGWPCYRGTGRVHVLLKDQSGPKGVFQISETKS